MRDSTIHKLGYETKHCSVEKPDSLSSHVLIPWNEHEPPHLVDPKSCFVFMPKLTSNFISPGHQRASTATSGFL
jgi:hypothetical protein